MDNHVFMNSFFAFMGFAQITPVWVYILDTASQIDRVCRTTWSITVLPLPALPDPVRIMLEGLDLTMRIARTASAVDMAAERAYGFELGIETVKALPPETISNL